MRPVDADNFTARALTREPHANRRLQDDILDALFLIRVLYAAIAGLIFGIVPLTGLPAFATFVISQYANGAVWLRYQDIDPEEYDTESSMQAEGVGQSVSLFLVSGPNAQLKMWQQKFPRVSNIRLSQVMSSLVHCSYSGSSPILLYTSSPGLAKLFGKEAASKLGWTVLGSRKGCWRQSKLFLCVPCTTPLPVICRHAAVRALAEHSVTNSWHPPSLGAPGNGPLAY